MLRFTASSTKTRIVFYFERFACLNSVIEIVLSLFLRHPWMPRKSENEHKKKSYDDRLHPLLRQTPIPRPTSSNHFGLGGLRGRQKKSEIIPYLSLWLH